MDLQFAKEQASEAQYRADRIRMMATRVEDITSQLVEHPDVTLPCGCTVGSHFDNLLGLTAEDIVHAVDQMESGDYSLWHELNEQVREAEDWLEDVKAMADQARQLRTEMLREASAFLADELAKDEELVGAELFAIAQQAREEEELARLVGDIFVESLVSQIEANLGLIAGMM